MLTLTALGALAIFATAPDDNPSVVKEMSVQTETVMHVWKYMRSVITVRQSADGAISVNPEHPFPFEDLARQSEIFGWRAGEEYRAQLSTGGYADLECLNTWKIGQRPSPRMQAFNITTGLGLVVLGVAIMAHNATNQVDGAMKWFMGPTITAMGAMNAYNGIAPLPKKDSGAQLQILNLKFAPSPKKDSRVRFQILNLKFRF